MIQKILFAYFTKENKTTKKLSEAEEVLIEVLDGFDIILLIDTDGRRNALPKDLSNIKGFYPFTEKEWAAFDGEFDLGFDDDREEEEGLKTAATAGEKFKLDSGYVK